MHFRKPLPAVLLVLASIPSGLAQSVPAPAGPAQAAALTSGKRIRWLNELEYINGEVYANIWQQDRIAIIQLNSGHVTWIMHTPGRVAGGVAPLICNRWPRSTESIAAS